MSMLSILRYKCSQCKRKFTFNNNCRCKMCNLKLDATICLSCHNNNHVNGVLASCILGLSVGAIMLSAKVVQIGTWLILG